MLQLVMQVKLQLKAAKLLLPRVAKEPQAFQMKNSSKLT